MARKLTSVARSVPVRRDHHRLADVLALGLVEMSTPPAQEAQPGFGLLQRYKVHHSFRLTDGLWHLFRYADAKKATERDVMLPGSMLPPAPHRPEGERVKSHQHQFACFEKHAGQLLCGKG